VATDDPGVFRWHEVPDPSFYVGLVFWTALGVWGYWKLEAKGCLATAAVIVGLMVAVAFFAHSFVLDDKGISHTGFFKRETARWSDVREVGVFESSSTDAKMSLATGRRLDTSESERHLGVFLRSGAELRIPMDYRDSSISYWISSVRSSSHDQALLKRAVLRRLPADARARSMAPMAQHGVPDPGDK
jgi:hypothetical protein